MHKQYFSSQNQSQKLRVRLIHGYVCAWSSQKPNLYSKNFLRCQEKGAVCVFKCLSANLALQEFFKAIHFCFTRTTKYQQTRNLHSFAQRSVTSTHIFPPRSIKYHKIREYSRGKWSTVSLFLITTFIANLIVFMDSRIISNLLQGRNSLRNVYFLVKWHDKLAILNILQRLFNN